MLKEGSVQIHFIYLLIIAIVNYIICIFLVIR